MIRACGAALVLLSCVIFLIEERGRQRREVQMAEDFLGALESMETAIRWEKCSLPDIVSVQEQRPYAGVYFQEIHTKLRKNMTLQEAWEDTFCRVKPQRISEILCGISLSGDSAFLENHLAYAAKEIRSFQTQERERQTMNRRVKSAAAVSAACTIIILLL